jgi:hypothetical protein
LVHRAIESATCNRGEACIVRKAVENLRLARGNGLQIVATRSARGRSVHLAEPLGPAQVVRPTDLAVVVVAPHFISITCQSGSHIHSTEHSVGLCRARSQVVPGHTET